MTQNSDTQSRRSFLKTSSIAVAATAAAPYLNLTTSAQNSSDVLKVGLIGCGGRGTGAASQALHADKNVVLTAMADVFDSKLQGSLEALTPRRCGL